MMNADSALRASPGDRLVIRGHHVGDAPHDAEIVEVLGDGGGPPYVVRWEDGHTTRVYPGSDAYVQHFEHGPAPRAPSESPAAGGLPTTEDWEAGVPPRDS